MADWTRGKKRREEEKRGAISSYLGEGVLERQHLRAEASAPLERVRHELHLLCTGR